MELMQLCHSEEFETSSFTLIDGKWYWILPAAKRGGGTVTSMDMHSFFELAIRNNAKILVKRIALYNAQSIPGEWHVKHPAQLHANSVSLASGGFISFVDRKFNSKHYAILQEAPWTDDESTRRIFYKETGLISTKAMTRQEFYESEYAPEKQNCKPDITINADATGFTDKALDKAISIILKGQAQSSGGPNLQRISKNRQKLVDVTEEPVYDKEELRRYGREYPTLRSIE